MFLSSCLEELCSYIFSYFHWKTVVDFWSLTYSPKVKYKINLEINFYYTKWRKVETYGMNVGSFHMFLHASTHAHTHTNIYIYIYIHTHKTHVYIYIYIYIYIYTYIYIYIHTHVLVCIYIYISTHTHTHMYACPTIWQM